MSSPSEQQPWKYRTPWGRWEVAGCRSRWPEAAQPKPIVGRNPGRAELIEDENAVREAVKDPNRPSFASRSGSRDSFQVFVRAERFQQRGWPCRSRSKADGRFTVRV